MFLPSHPVTLELDEDQLDELVGLLGTASRSEAVRRAVDECLKAHRREWLHGIAQQLRSHAGVTAGTP
jgi:metal-responsive CopG/Arc/MetJ family transcriptional regulator